MAARCIPVSSGLSVASLLKLCGYHDGGSETRRLSKSVRHGVASVEDSPFRGAGCEDDGFLELCFRLLSDRR